MIQYDPERKTVFSPTDLKLEGHPRKCLLIFDDEIWEDFVLPKRELTTLPVKNAFGRIFDTYRYLNHNGEKILLVYPTTGSAGAVCDVELLIASGIDKIVAFGTCGRMDKNLAKNTIILPTAAEREEGTSYHYLPDSDEIEVDKKALTTARTVFNQAGFTTVEGKIWTTDAVYRETYGKVKLMQERGCVGVDMELSALLALAQYRNIKFFEFLIGEDAVSGNTLNGDPVNEDAVNQDIINRDAVNWDTKEPLERNSAKIFQTALRILDKL